MSTKATIILAAGLLIVVFVVGVFAGRVVQEKPKTTATTSVETSHVPKIDDELAACRQELAALSIPKVSSSVTAPDERKRADADEEAKVAVLEKELEQCKKSDFLHGIDMCLAPSRYGVLFITVLHADKACVDRFGVRDLILRHLDQCPDYNENNKPEYGTEDFPQRDQSKVGSVVDDPRRFPDRKGNHERHMRRLIRECRTKFGLSDE